MGLNNRVFVHNGGKGRRSGLEVTPPPTDTLITSTGESSFNFGAFDPSRLSVFNSGVAIFSPDVDVSSGNSVVFSESTLADEELLLTEGPSNITRTATPITSAGQASFNIVGGFNPLSSYVFLGGKRLVGAEVDISNGTDIVITDGTLFGEVVTLVEITGATFAETEYTALGGESVINVGLYSQNALDIWINGILFYGSNLEYTSSTTVTILNLAPLKTGELVTINKWSN